MTNLPLSPSEARRRVGLVLTAAVGVALLCGGCLATGAAAKDVQTLRQAVASVEAEVSAAVLQVDKLEAKIANVAGVGGVNDNLTTWLAVGGGTLGGPILYLIAFRPLRLKMFPAKEGK